MDRKIWLTSSSNLGGHKFVRDITGHTINTTDGDPTTLNSDGLVIYKRSPAGEVIIQNVHGSGKIETPQGIKEISVSTLSQYIPNPNSADARDLEIKIDKSTKRNYSTLRELLEIFRKSESSIQKLELEEQLLKEQAKEADENELDRIVREKEKALAERESILSKARSFIRRSAELRYQPIMDPWQDEVMRSLIFNGTLAIDGGPGTGKTTALIQRIRFLLDKEAMLGSNEADPEFINKGYMPGMSLAQQNKIFNNDRNWVFFTPNELLKLFLRNNMIQEGLNADDQRVKVWKDYLIPLIKDYELVKTDTQNLFLFLRKNLEESLLPNSGNEIEALIKSFERHFLDLLNKKLETLINLKLERFEWKAKGISIQNYIKQSDQKNKIESIVRLYFNLQETYKEEVVELRNKFNEQLAKAAARIERESNRNDTFKNEVYQFAETWKKQSNTNLDSELEEEDEELEDTTGELEGFLFGKYKLLIKNSALAKFDPSVRLSKKYQELNLIVEKYISFNEFDTFDQIGQLAYFVKYFVSCIKGVSRNVFSEIPKTYKEFRKSEASNPNSNWNIELLNTLISDEKSRNKRLHPEEQSFLIYFINRTIKKSYKVSKVNSDQINHSYFEGYRNNSVPVIGIDEATDFHLVDLLAMHSLSDMEISSVTFSGDLMQRLTTGGIRDWKELKNLISPVEIKELLVSYRQSPTLLSLAGDIFKKATGKEAEYISHMEKDASEPKPLIFRSDNEEEKIDWISNRILEIYNAYGRELIPSIAVFLPNKEGIEEFTELLSEKDELADVGIKVRASKEGEVLGDKNVVRIFPVEYIKGMEFEAVFFHNIHGIQDSFESEEMIMKHLYVGLSRASFYIGVTTNKDGKFEFLDDHFDRNRDWK
ncbi:hypothetical protein [Roseivirga pacifica]|nr:hypothetical protein [Roseivirga pacifica]